MALSDKGRRCVCVCVWKGVGRISGQVLCRTSRPAAANVPGFGRDARWPLARCTSAADRDGGRSTLADGVVAQGVICITYICRARGRAVSHGPQPRGSKLGSTTGRAGGRSGNGRKKYIAAAAAAAAKRAGGRDSDAARRKHVTSMTSAMPVLTSPLTSFRYPRHIGDGRRRQPTVPVGKKYAPAART